MAEKERKRDTLQETTEITFHSKKEQKDEKKKKFHLKPLWIGKGILWNINNPEALFVMQKGIKKKKDPASIWWVYYTTTISFLPLPRTGRSDVITTLDSCLPG